MPCFPTLPITYLYVTVLPPVVLLPDRISFLTSKYNHCLRVFSKPRATKMKFIYQAMLFAFIASTTALPQAMRRDSSTCGSDQQLSCCVTSTKVRRDPKSVIDLLTSGLGLDTITKALGLAPLTKGAVLLDQCSPMNITLAGKSFPPLPAYHQY